MSEQVKIRVLVADDHPVVREGIIRIINSVEDCHVIGEASNGQEALDIFQEIQPDITLLDLKMPVMGGLQTIKELRLIDPSAKIIVLTAYDSEESVYQAIVAGAMAYIVKDTVREDLIDVIRSTYLGKKVVNFEMASKLVERVNKPDLTDRELTILKLVAQGHSNREISTLLVIAEGTVKVHLSKILDKLDAKDRTDAVGIALRRGLIEVS